MRKISWLALFIFAGYALLVLAGSIIFTSRIIFQLSSEIQKAPLINDMIPVERGRYSIGQTFSAEEENEIIKIASGDPFMTGAIWFEERGSLPNNTHVARVTVDKYFERVPDHAPYNSFWMPRYRVLPVVVFNRGDPDYEGVDVYAYVDVDKGYVPYLGHVIRPGLKGEDNFRVLADGVKTEDFTNGSLYSVSFEDNTSIVYTAFIPPKNMTAEQKADVLDIVLNDSRVKSAVNGYEYEVGAVHSDAQVDLGAGGGYYLGYPCVNFLVTYEGEQVPLMKVVVDRVEKRVVVIDPYYTPPGKKVQRYSLF